MFPKSAKRFSDKNMLKHEDTERVRPGLIRTRSSLVRVESRNDLTVVWLTQAGEDAALGRTIVEGVLRPAPQEPY